MFAKINTKIAEARDEEGFTLIELLVVILIIGILAAIAIPVFLNQQKAAVKGGIKSDVRNTVTNVATSLVTSPSATGFTTYAAGTTAPTVTGGAVAVQTVNSGDDTVTITKNPSSGAAPSTGTGAGQWDDYQIVGTSARVPNYCFVFSSTSGKYTEYNDCTVAADAGSGSGSTAAPTTPAPTTTLAVAYDFDNPATKQGWTTTSSTSSISTSQSHNGANSLHITASGSTGNMAYIQPAAIVKGSTYTVTGWVYPVTNNLPYLLMGGAAAAKSPTVATLNTWTQMSVTFTAESNAPFVELMTKQAGTSNTTDLYFDDVTISKVN